LHLFDQRGLGWAWAHDIEAEIVAGVLASQRSRKGDDPGLGPGIDRFSHAADAASV